MKNDAARATDHDIAIVGMAARLPGAESVQEFWRNLIDGRESIQTFGKDDLLRSGLPASLIDDPSFVPRRGTLAGIDRFDAAFFACSPREAELIDPQQRLFLETAWTAFEDAGYAPGERAMPVGVFAGSNQNTYLLFHLLKTEEDLCRVHQLLIHSDKDFLATRVSHKLNLTGPSLTVQTACSTSLVTVHLACQSLLAMECDMALAGGVSVVFPQAGYLYQKGGVFSPDGHVRAFDANAAGTLGSDGVGVVVLKRLTDALRDGDHIHAVILGSAVNNDGSHKASYAAPSADGQMKVIQEALGVADVDPQTIGYIETHGTATHLGDAVEITALKRVFAPHKLRRGACVIGSVKPNIGHTDQAAGVANLIKAALIVNQGVMPPSLHCDEVNPALGLDDSPFVVNRILQPWPAGTAPRRAGVSSFGFGGTNAHVIVEQPPSRAPSPSSRAVHLLTLSARSEAALERSTELLAEHLAGNPDLSLADAAFVLQQGRSRFARRRFIVAASVGEAQRLLQTRDRKAMVDKVVVVGSSAPHVYFLFPGQGAQFVQMGRELYASEPVFRDELNRAARALLAHDIDLLSLLFPAEGEQAAAEAALNQTGNTQPVLFALEVALARLLLAYGVNPTGMLGHSVGEFTAACLAGVFEFEDALALVTLRGRLMQSLPPGTMLSVQASPTQLRELLPAQVAIAAVNAENLCVLSGAPPVIAELEAALAQRKLACQRLHTSHAFHSAMMDPIVETFERAVGQVKRLPSLAIPFVSNVTGVWITAEQATAPQYWGRHLRQSVLFADGAATLLASADAILIEVGPGRSLTSMLRQQQQLTPRHTLLRTMRHPRESGGDLELLLTMLGTLWLNQVQVDWNRFHAHERRHRVPLPTYAFERSRYFVAPRTLGGSATPADGTAAPLAAGASEPGTVNADTTSDYERPALASSFRAPETQCETILAEVWQQVLGFKQVGADDDFFELGGDSLSAIHVAASIKERFPIDLEVIDMLDHATLADIAALVEGRLVEKLAAMSEDEVALLLAD